MSERALVVGLGRSGAAVTRQLQARGFQVTALDDSAPSEEGADDVGARAKELGVELRRRARGEELTAMVRGADVVVPSPGVPPAHPVFEAAAAAGLPVRGEVELASHWARAPIVAVTGTNGKTTVTELITEMLVASGRRALAAGNHGTPLSDVVGRDVDVLVCEVSSFQLWSTVTFEPAVAVWLNLAPDHFDWHSDMPSYFAAKSRIWANQRGRELAVANADDPLVLVGASQAPAAVTTFTLGREGDYFLAEERGRPSLFGPRGGMLPVAELPRALPHDLANSLAAAAAALAAGASLNGVRQALRLYTGPPHRVTLVGEAGGVRWYDDSKATNPHAALAAIASFASVVLIAGGRNKGLDLGILAAASGHLRAVVGLGEAGPELERAFAGIRPVTIASTMDEAVHAAAAFAQPGDVVLLSPGCASFDRYGSYSERGDDFIRAVATRIQPSRPSGPGSSE